jgi:hypothetical protein
MLTIKSYGKVPECTVVGNEGKLWRRRKAHAFSLASTIAASTSAAKRVMNVTANPALDIVSKSYEINIYFPRKH